MAAKILPVPFVAHCFTARKLRGLGPNLTFQYWNQRKPSEDHTYNLTIKDIFSYIKDCVLHCYRPPADTSHILRHRLHGRSGKIFEPTNFLPQCMKPRKFCSCIVYMSPCKFLLVSTLEWLFYQKRVTILQSFTAKTVQNLPRFRCLHEFAQRLNHTGQIFWPTSDQIKKIATLSFFKKTLHGSAGPV